MVGNLVVRADPTFGGGELNLTGSGLSTAGNKVDYQMSLNSNGFNVVSAGSVDIFSGNQSAFNGVGSDVTVIAGSGLSSQGGSGGSVVVQAGDGQGEDQFGGNIGTGGDVQLSAGNAVQGSGGNVQLQAGSSIYGIGGIISIKSGSQPW